MQEEKNIGVEETEENVAASDSANTDTTASATEKDGEKDKKKR